MSTREENGHKLSGSNAGDVASKLSANNIASLAIKMHADRLISLIRLGPDKVYDHFDELSGRIQEIRKLNSSMWSTETDDSANAPCAEYMYSAWNQEHGFDVDDSYGRGFDDSYERGSDDSYEQGLNDSDERGLDDSYERVGDLSGPVDGSPGQAGGSPDQSGGSPERSDGSRERGDGTPEQSENSPEQADGSDAQSNNSHRSEQHTSLDRPNYYEPRVRKTGKGNRKRKAATAENKQRKESRGGQERSETLPDKNALPSEEVPLATFNSCKAGPSDESAGGQNKSDSIKESAASGTSSTISGSESEPREATSGSTLSTSGIGTTTGHSSGNEIIGPATDQTAGSSSADKSSQSTASSLEPSPYVVDTKQFEVIFQRWEQFEDHGSLIAADTTMLHHIQHLIDSAFDSQRPSNLRRIVPMANHFMQVLGPLTVCGRKLAVHQQNRASEMASVPDFASRNWGAILCWCDSGRDDQDPTPVEELLEVKKAIFRLDKNDDTAQADFESEVSDQKLKDFLQIGYPLRKLVKHSLHLATVLKIFAELTVFETFAHLKREKYLKELAAKLARSINPAVPFDESTTILFYMEQFALPGQEMDGHEELAAEVTCEILDSMTNTKGSKRKLFLPSFFARAGVQDYCGDADDGKHKERRLRMTRITKCILLKRAIQRRFPSHLFSKRGYTHSLLRLSPTDVVHATIDLKPDFFKAYHDEESNIFQAFCKNVVSKKFTSDDDDTGKCNLLIESTEQVESLKQLKLLAAT